MTRTRARQTGDRRRGRSRGPGGTQATPAARERPPTPRERRVFAEQTTLAALALQLADMLQRKGVTQRQLAGRLGVTEARVSQILSADGNPTVKTLARIAAALDCAVVIRFERTPAQKRERMAAIGGAVVDALATVLKAGHEKPVPRQPFSFVPTGKPILLIGGPK